MPRAAISWSGGKDSCAALHRTHADYDIVAMVTMFDEEAERSRSHGLRPEVLAAQADRLGLRASPGRCTWQTYDAAFSDALSEVKADGVTHVIFGDILFDEHRRWAEQMCDAAGADRRRAAVRLVDGRAVRRVDGVGRRGADRHGSRGVPRRDVARAALATRAGADFTRSASTRAASAASTTPS